MNKIIEYVKHVRSVDYEWNIDGKKVIVTYFTHDYREELSIFIDKLEQRLKSRDKLITNEGKAMYGKRWSVRNALELSAVLFPELTTEYIKYIIDVSIEQNEEFGNTSLFKLTVGRSESRGEIVFPTFFSIMKSEQIRKMKELGVFKYAFNYNSYEYKIEFIGKEDGYFAWRINDKVTKLTGINQEDSSLLIHICFEVQKRLENNEPILGSKCTCYPIKMGKKNIINIAGDIFTDLTKQYIERFMYNMSKDRELTGITNFYSTILSYNNKRCGYELDDTNFEKMLRYSLEKYNSVYLDKFIKSNFTEGIKGDLWKLYQQKEGTSYSFTRLDFSDITKPLFKAEVKSFIKDELSNSDNYEYQSYSLRKLYVGLDYILKNFSEVNSCADINIHMVIALRDFLQIEATKFHGDEKLTVSTQAKIMQKLKQLYDHLIYNDNLAITKPKTNPFEHVSYHNLENMEKNTEPIPDEIIKDILKHIDDLEPMYQRVLLISLNTGLRFKEIAYLEKNNLYYDEENTAWKLEYIPWKILEARRKQNLDDYAFVVIQEFLVDEIKEQIEETEVLRDELKSNKIFLREKKTLEFGRKAITIIDGDDFNRKINKIIKKYRIVNNDGELWKFAHKQCRKTLAVDMITSGMSSQEVSYQLGHLKAKTTEKYYSEVRKYKLADMNSEFFRKKFNLLVTEEQLSNYSEEERRLLYIGFCTDYREVELGKCIKSFSEGKCKRSGEESCATCDKLCVSYENTSKWEKLYNSKREVIENMESIYKKEGIDKTEYTQFREYQKELHLYMAYKDVLDKLKAGR